MYVINVAWRRQTYFTASPFCPKIENYWSELFKTLFGVVNISIELDLVLIVLGISELISMFTRRLQQTLIV